MRALAAGSLVGAMTASYAFDAVVWEYDGPGGWHFISLPPDQADEIAERVASRAAGFGSVRVEATIGATRWTTSLFPDRRRRTYLLPVKKSVRSAEDLVDGSVARVHLVVIDAESS